MSYRLEKETGDIVFEGFGDGIAGSPHKGIGDLRVADITTVPGEVMCNYGRTRQSPSATSGSIAASTSNTLIVTVGVGALNLGSFIQITSSNITNLTLNSYYWIKAITDNGDGTFTINLSTNGYTATLKNDLGTTGVASFTQVNMGKPIAEFSDFQVGFPDTEYFVLDDSGYLWRYSKADTTPSWKMAMASITDIKKNSNATNAGLFVYGNYVIAVTDALYYKYLSALGTAWAAFSTNRATLSDTYTHYSIVGHDAVAYITDRYNLISLTVVAGTDPTAFDPTNSSTYTYNSTALQLPHTEVLNYLAELGTNLAIGCWSNNLYFWSRTPVSIGGGNTLNSFFYPVLLPENFVQNMQTVNNLLYVFCGSTGRIYVTNGSTVSPVLKIPDSVTSQVEPYFIWGDTEYIRGRIFFSVKDSNSKTGGIWSFVPQQSYFIEQDVGSSLRLEAQNTYATYAGMATLIFAAVDNGSQYPSQNPGQQARGPQYWAGWDDGTGGVSATPYGIDYSSTTPGLTVGAQTTQGQTSIDLDIVPTGTFLKKRTFKQIEYKLSAPPASGESVAINYRTDLTTAFASCGSVETESSQSLSGIVKVPFEKTQWVQLQLVLTSTTSSPSFVRVVQVRMR